MWYKDPFVWSLLVVLFVITLVLMFFMQKKNTVQKPVNYGNIANYSVESFIDLINQMVENQKTLIGIVPLTGSNIINNFPKQSNSVGENDLGVILRVEKMGVQYKFTILYAIDIGEPSTIEILETSSKAQLQSLVKKWYNKILFLNGYQIQIINGPELKKDTNNVFENENTLIADQDEIEEEIDPDDDIDTLFEPVKEGKYRRNISASSINNTLDENLPVPEERFQTPRKIVPESQININNFIRN
jgi:hypothetical protein